MPTRGKIDSKKAAPRRRSRKSSSRTVIAATARQPTQREALLDEAAREFNARGIATTSVNDVARRIGLTRAAVYYYVKDSEDLVFQCYMRACQLMAEDLARAHEEGTDDLARIEAFIRRVLSPDRPPAAVVSEIPYLSTPMRNIVEAEHGKNILALEQIISSGIRNGTIRECDPQVVAQTIFGIVSWVVLSPGWMGKGGDRGFAQRMTDALTDQLEHGITGAAREPVQCSIDVRSLVAQPSNPFDRDAAAAFKTEQVLETASRLFNERGIDGTSLDQIATELGATKGVLYHYFTDKSELALRCYERSASLYERIADLAETSGRNGVERAMIGLHLNVQAQVAGPSPLVPLVGFEAIPPGPRKALQQRLNRLQQRFARFGSEGIADGSIRESDVDALSLAGAGMFGWIPKWLPADARDRKFEIADQLVRLWMTGLRQA